VPFNEGNASTVEWFYLSNAFRGETSAGTWTLEIVDAWAQAEGTLVSADLQFFGETKDDDDLYVYTEEFSDFAGDGNHLTVLNDTNGGIDTLNAAAVISNSTVNLDGTATIDGQTITSVTGIENVYTGDGNDVINGNDADNILSGGRGDDRINGDGGSDTLSDGEGRDFLSGQAGADIYDLGIDDSIDIIRGFEDSDSIRLAEGDLDFGDLRFIDLNEGLVLVAYAGDIALLIDRGNGITSADFDASDFIFV